MIWVVVVGGFVWPWWRVRVWRFVVWWLVSFLCDWKGGGVYCLAFASWSGPSRACVYSTHPLVSLHPLYHKSNKTKINQLREKYGKAKYVPLDLRFKKTRAIRRRLTKHEVRTDS